MDGSVGRVEEAFGAEEDAIDTVGCGALAEAEGNKKVGYSEDSGSEDSGRRWVEDTAGRPPGYARPAL